LHEGQLASDRTSCRSTLANQVRLVLHTAAYWLLLTLRDLIPGPHELAGAEFASGCTCSRWQAASPRPPAAPHDQRTASA
jgi:hypothetical protein